MQMFLRTLLSSGVPRALELLRSEMERVMALIGCRTVAELDRRFLHLADSV